MTIREFGERVLMNLPYEANDQQVQLIAALARFCSPSMPGERVFLLSGYAGTGKTSLTGALVKALGEAGVTSILLAPTGRAAKVFASFAHHTAYTIHRKIYRPPAIGDTSSSVGAIAENRHINTIFIVDEASMIGATSENGSNLLDDLIHYVYSGHNCRLLLLGDTAQLPPVGCEDSPAMNPKVLQSYGLKVTRAVLTETVRQAGDSGILYNATFLRRAMKAEQLPAPVIYETPFPDVEIVPGELLAESLSDAYGRDGVEQTILITRSNKRATQFNQAIRANILYKEEELTRDELLLVAKNNYYWTSKVKGIDFIANGDVATIVKVYGSEYKYDCRFADVSLHFPDHDVTLDCKIMLSSLLSEHPALDPDRMNKLYQACLYDTELFATDAPMSVRLKGLKSNPYFNALQVKYAYAVTCHKAQGGQWRNVYVDMGYIPPEAQGLEFYRWLYTATTRATTRIYYLNPGVEIK